MVPAAIVIIAMAIGGLILWSEDRRTIQALKRDMDRIATRVRVLEEQVSDAVLRKRQD
jgi:chaperonin cofactor prefoldin